MKVISAITVVLVALIGSAFQCEAFAPTGGSNHPSAPVDTMKAVSALERLNNRLSNIQQDIQTLSPSFKSPFASRAPVDAQTRLSTRISLLKREAGQVRVPVSALAATRAPTNSYDKGTNLSRLIEQVKASRMSSTGSPLTTSDKNKQVLSKTLSETMAIAEARDAENAERSALGVRMETATNPAARLSTRIERELPISISERISSRPY